MNIYYIDYENVSSQGLKGVEALTENDEVILLYSKKADNVKIDILTMLMESKAKIRFLPVHVGTPNALDFQLVTLLFLNYKDDDYCYIISKDSGYDCCIKTAAQNGAPNVARYPNIESALNKTDAKKSRRGKRTAKNEDSVSDSMPAGEAAQKSAQNAPASLNQAQDKETPDSAKNTPNDLVPADTAARKEPVESVSASPEGNADENTKKKPARRRGRKKAVSSDSEAAAPQTGTAETPQTDTGKKPEPEKVQEHVLQQRYLTKQFDQKNSQTGSSASKGDADKPVSILSVIRRRNDVQLDMHQIDLIREALKNSSNKQQFYSYFVKKLGQKQGIELYHSVKSSYTDLVNANLQ